VARKQIEIIKEVYKWAIGGTNTKIETKNPLCMISSPKLYNIVCLELKISDNVNSIVMHYKLLRWNL
jgi:hypothetical protein